MARIPFDSYLSRLQDDLVAVKVEMDGLLDISTIRNVDPYRPNDIIVAVGFPKWGWGPSDAKTYAAQMDLLAHYRAWIERFKLLFPHPTKDISSKIDKTDKFILHWINHDKGDHSIPPSIDQAKTIAAQKLGVFDELLGIVARGGQKMLLVVPDTNALIRNPSVEDYSITVGSANYMVHIVTAVLAELDELKNRGRTPDVREGAEKAVRRLKGFRDRGRLSEGVKVSGNIRLKLEHREVDTRSVLSWLDPSVPDDRILAAALRLQSDNPGGVVVLISADINLQNKADAVGLPYAEPPAPKPLAQSPKG